MSQLALWKLGARPAESLPDGFVLLVRVPRTFFILATGVVCSLLSPSLSFFRPPRLVMCPSWIRARRVIDVRGHANLCWCRDKDFPFCLQDLEEVGCGFINWDQGHLAPRLRLEAGYRGILWACDERTGWILNCQIWDLYFENYIFAVPGSLIPRSQNACWVVAHSRCKTSFSHVGRFYIVIFVNCLA
jgi:hypothetical protein